MLHARGAGEHQMALYLKINYYRNSVSEPFRTVTDTNARRFLT